MPGQAVYTPGPIFHFVSFRDSPGQWFYLGTAVIDPEMENEKFKLPVMNDLGGRSVPFQLVQDGEQWSVMITLNRFDFSLVKKIRDLESGRRNVPAGNPGATVPFGSESGYARGTLVLGISDFQLVIVNSYALTPAAGQGPTAALLDLYTGRLWNSVNQRKYAESRKGSRTMEVSMFLEGLGIFNPVTRGFDTYSEAVDPAPFMALVT